MTKEVSERRGVAMAWYWFATTRENTTVANFPPTRDHSRRLGKKNMIRSLGIPTVVVEGHQFQQCVCNIDRSYIFFSISIPWFVFCSSPLYPFLSPIANQWCSFLAEMKTRAELSFLKMFLYKVQYIKSNIILARKSLLFGAKDPSAACNWFTSMARLGRNSTAATELAQQ